MEQCLFCQSTGPYSTIEHVVPESLGNDDLLLLSQVCDSCQAYFGKEVERFVLDKTPFAFWRTFLGIQTKRKHNPVVDLSQSKRQKGRIPAVHPLHDNIGFIYHEDDSLSVEIEDSQIIQEILDGSRTQFKFVFTPKILHMMGRFLCKVGIELLCLHDPIDARSEALFAARKYARFGKFDQIWPLFHFSRGNLHDFIRYSVDEEGVIQEVDYYSYSLFHYGDNQLLFRFSMGTDNWVICLDNPYPHPIIRNAFPEDKLKLIWYPKD